MRRTVIKARAAAALIAVGMMFSLLWPQAASATTQMTATVGVNIRYGASTQSTILGGLYRGQTVTAISSTAGWTKIKFGDSIAYVASRYLTKGKDLPAPKKIGAGHGQDHHYGAEPSHRPRLVLSPKITGTRYATATLNIRSTYADKYKLITEVPRGTKLNIIGVVKNSRMQIILEKTVRWVTAKYLSKSAPSSIPPSWRAVEQGLKPNAIKVHRAARAKFPQITTYYTLRAGVFTDHSTGRALDLMILNYRSASGKALGYKVAAWAKANARDLGINYVIWNQHIWNIQRDSEGWRYMADRGGDSANHKNHVHITVFAAGYDPR